MCVRDALRHTRLAENGKISKEVYCLKDLKHLIYFENLLQDAQNELVTQAVNEGKYALGYNCYYIPEVLLNLPGCFSSRLRAPRCTSTDVASYYMTNRTCPYARSILERAIEGGYNYLNALFGAECCATMERMEEHFFLINPVKNDRFFVTQIDPPMKGDKTNLDYYKAQLKLKVVDKLHDEYGIDTSEEAMRKAIEDHNEISRIITEIGNFRKAENPNITGYEFHVIELVSQVCPHYLIKPYLEETLEELKTREPEEKFPFRAKVVLVGSEIDDPEFTKLVESCGAMVVADRYCYGAVESRIPIVVKEGQEPLDAIARHYLDTSNCPRFMPQDTMRARKQRIADLARDYHADGVIVASNKFCEYWSYERVIDTVVLPRDFGLPVCSIEKEYINSASGQLRTRFQAFVESIEIKKIQEGK